MHVHVATEPTRGAARGRRRGHRDARPAARGAHGRLCAGRARVRRRDRRGARRPSGSRARRDRGGGRRAARIGAGTGARVSRAVHPSRALRVRPGRPRAASSRASGPGVEGRTRPAVPRSTFRPRCAPRSTNAASRTLDDGGVCTAESREPFLLPARRCHRPPGDDRGARRDRVAARPRGRSASASRPRPGPPDAAARRRSARRGLEGGRGRGGRRGAGRGPTRLRREPRAGAPGEGRRVASAAARSGVALHRAVAAKQGQGHRAARRVVALGRPVGARRGDRARTLPVHACWCR